MGSECKEGGGMPDGNSIGFTGLASGPCWAISFAPVAANTAGGIACISVSRWCMRSSSVAVLLHTGVST